MSTFFKWTNVNFSDYWGPWLSFPGSIHILHVFLAYFTIYLLNSKFNCVILCISAQKSLKKKNYIYLYLMFHVFCPHKSMGWCIQAEQKKTFRSWLEHCKLSKEFGCRFSLSLPIKKPIKWQQKTQKETLEGCQSWHF